MPINSNDFINGPLKNFGVEVTRTARSKYNDNVTGDETLSDGVSSTITVVFEPTNSEYYQDIQGDQKVADVRMFIKPTDTVNKYDKITYQGKDYEVVNDPQHDKRSAGTANMFKKVLLILESDG